MTTAILTNEQGKPLMAADKSRAVRELVETLAALAALLMSPSSEEEKLSTMLEMQETLCAVTRGLDQAQAGSINKAMARIAGQSEVINLHLFGDQAKQLH